MGYDASSGAWSNMFVGVSFVNSTLPSSSMWMVGKTSACDSDSRVIVRFPGPVKLTEPSDGADVVQMKT